MWWWCAATAFFCVTAAPSVRCDGVTVVEDDYGVVDNQTIKRYTFSNANNITAEIITYGGRISAIRMPDIGGDVQDIVLGFDNLEGLSS
jgi:aldose 1-epimerase